MLRFSLLTACLLLFIATPAHAGTYTPRLVIVDMSDTASTEAGACVRSVREGFKDTFQFNMLAPAAFARRLKRDAAPGFDEITQDVARAFTDAMLASESGNFGHLDDEGYEGLMVIRCDPEGQRLSVRMFSRYHDHIESRLVIQGVSMDRKRALWAGKAAGQLPKPHPKLGRSMP